MPESWRSFSLSFLTRWDVQCLFLPWEAKSSLELGAEQFTKQAEDESERKRLGMHYLNTYSHLKPQRAPRGTGHSTVYSSDSTEELGCSLGDKNHPQKLFCHQLSPHLCFILAGSNTAQVFSGTCTGSAAVTSALR